MAVVMFVSAISIPWFKADVPCRGELGQPAISLASAVVTFLYKCELRVYIAIATTDLDDS